MCTDAKAQESMGVRIHMHLPPCTAVHNPSKRIITKAVFPLMQAGSAEDFVVGVADKLFFGDIETAGARILKDYRTGALVRTGCMGFSRFPFSSSCTGQA